jgi:hypothetical protein
LVRCNDECDGSDQYDTREGAAALERSRAYSAPDLNKADNGDTQQGDVDEEITEWQCGANDEEAQESP